MASQQLRVLLFPINCMKGLLLLVLLIATAMQSITGNFTYKQLYNLTNIFTASQSYSLEEVPAYIKNHIGSGVWNILILSNQTTGACIDAPYNKSTSNKYLTWVNYGFLRRTYILLRDDQCRKEIPTPIGHAEEYFTPNVDALLIYRIKSLLSDAIVYRGADLCGNAIYIQQKLNEVKLGQWMIMISVGDPKMEGLSCSTFEEWGYINQFQFFKWNYFLTKIS